MRVRSTRPIHTSDPCVRSMRPIHASDPCVRSPIDPAHWIRRGGGGVTKANEFVEGAGANEFVGGAGANEFVGGAGANEFAATTSHCRPPPTPTAAERGVRPCTCGAGDRRRARGGAAPVGMGRGGRRGGPHRGRIRSFAEDALRSIRRKGGKRAQHVITRSRPLRTHPAPAAEFVARGTGVRRASGQERRRTSPATGWRARRDGLS